MHEMIGEVSYEYIPLGEHIVIAPGVCGGRPTFKYTRLEVSTVLTRIAQGDTIETIVDMYHQSNLSIDAVTEAIRLADQALAMRASELQPALA